MHHLVKYNALLNNQPMPLVDYLVPLTEGKQDVKILDVGSGPYPRTGQIIGLMERVEVTHCDKQDFTKFWEELGKKPFYRIEYQDMEKLTYPDNTFDIVHCVNALDHTRDALVALKEMIRVCKPGGWVYIDCNLDQLSTQGKKHYWDAKEDGTFVNLTDKIDLKDFGFDIEFVDNSPLAKGEYHRIIARLRK